MDKPNRMRELVIDKVTVNIGVGSPGERLDYAKELIGKLSGGRKPVETRARKREPAFKLRQGLPIGAMVTLRGKSASSFLEKALAARRKMLKRSGFDAMGNFSFGVPEYIDFPGAKYDPAMGMFGFDVCVTMKRRGKRVATRKIRSGKIGRKHRISPEEAVAFVKEKFGAAVE